MSWTKRTVNSAACFVLCVVPYRSSHTCWSFVSLNPFHVRSPASEASEVKQFCDHHECPSNWNNANEMNCCVYHANIHSCPLGLMVRTPSSTSSRLNLWFLQRPTVHLLVIAIIFILLYFFMCLFVIIYFSFLIISLASHKQSISGTLSWIFHIRALFLVLSFTKYISKTYFSFDLFMKWLRINQHFEQIANSSKETLY